MYFIGALLIPALWVIQASAVLWLAFVDAVRGQWMLGLTTVLALAAWFIPLKLWQWTVTPLAILILIATCSWGKRWVPAAIMGLVSVILVLGFAFRSEPQKFSPLNGIAILLWNCGPLFLALAVRETIRRQRHFEPSKD